MADDAKGVVGTVVGTVVDTATTTITLPYYVGRAAMETVGSSIAFQTIFGKGTIDTSDAGLEKMFMSIDADSSGKISSTEMETAVTKMYGGDVDPTFVKKMVESADIDKDGEVSLDEFKTIMRAEGALRYTAVSCGESALAASRTLDDPPPTDWSPVRAFCGPATSYFLRSDGAVDESRKGGTISKRYPRPSADVSYVGVSAGGWAGMDSFLRSDGKIFQIGAFTQLVVSPPEGVKYIQVATGEHNDYALRDDGGIDRGRKVFTPIDAPGMKFVQIAAGSMHSYFLCDDGTVMKTHGGGNLSREIGEKDSDVMASKYVSVGSQGVVTQNKDQHGSWYHYVLTAGGTDDVATCTSLSPADGPWLALSLTYLPRRRSLADARWVLRTLA
jgi:hypothetical protein